MNDQELEEAVDPQNEIMDQVIDEAQEQIENDPVEQEEKPRNKTMVPLSALQKEREKKREVELELAWERKRNAERASAPPQEQPEDNTLYESATRQDLMESNAHVQAQAIRAIEEKLWIKQNPDKHARITEELATFLKQRPNLARAINEASNRYEEAYTLMEALTPRQQIQLKKDAIHKKQQAPNSPNSVPKAASLNDAMDLMSMSDTEFAAWRKSKQKRR